MKNGMAKPPCHTAPRTCSFEKKPAKSGTPASDSVPTRNTMAVCGILRARPPISATSLLPTAWMIAPAPRNSSALKMPCISRCRNPDAANPAPIAAIM